jgi:hypothetical protein
MAITFDSDRQDVLTARVRITFDDVTDLVAEPAIDVPAGAVYAGGWVDIITPFNSATTDTLDVGDGDDPDRYSATPINIAAAAGTRSMLDDIYGRYAEKDTIDVVWDGTGAVPTAGEVELVFQYVREDRGTETQV